MSVPCSLFVCLDTITTTLSSCSSLLLPVTQAHVFSTYLYYLISTGLSRALKSPICLLSRTGCEMLTFVQCMMEWLGGTVSEEDVGEEASGKRNTKRNRDEDAEDEVIGTLALRSESLNVLLYIDCLRPMFNIILIISLSQVYDPICGAVGVCCLCRALEHAQRQNHCRLNLHPHPPRAVAVLCKCRLRRSCRGNVSGFLRPNARNRELHTRNSSEPSSFKHHVSA